MHLKRWITGLVAVPALIYIIGFGPGWLFYVLIFFASVIGLLEFFGITIPKLPTPIKVASFVLSFFLFYSILYGQFFMTLAVISLWVIIPLTLYLLLYRSQRDQATEYVSKIVFGLVYLCLPLSLLAFIRNLPKGDIWIFFLLAVTFMSDIGAFYFGRIFGRHKLYPSVSPGKTWEGAIGGLASSLIPVFLFPHFILLYTLNLWILTLTVAISISGQIGDLAESMLKRNYGVKDSGKILPGHGGILDRIDGLLFSIPILYIYLSPPWG